MQSLQDLHVLRQLTSEREAQLHDMSPATGDLHAGTPVRRRLGGLIVRLGAWVAAEPTLLPAPAQ